MRYYPFAARNRKELMRDPVSLIFGIGLPIVLLLLVTTIQRSMGDMQVEIFDIENFTPGIAMFSLSFIALFSGMLLADDRSSSFLARLFASPLSASDFIIGYSLPLIPMAFVQVTVCFVAAFFLGLPVHVNVLFAIVSLLPVAILFIGLGLLLGSVLSDKQVGPISSIIVQVAALSSGMWFPLDMIGGVFRTICNLLPFSHAVELTQAVLAGKYASTLPDLSWVLGYATVIFILAVVFFRKQMKG